MSYIDSFDIDDLDDFNIVESIIKNLEELKNKFNIHDYIVTESLKLEVLLLVIIFKLFHLKSHQLLKIVLNTEMIIILLLLN